MFAASARLKVSLKEATHLEDSTIPGIMALGDQVADKHPRIGSTVYKGGSSPLSL